MTSAFLPCWPEANICPLLETSWREMPHPHPTRPLFGWLESENCKTTWAFNKGCVSRNGSIGGSPIFFGEASPKISQMHKHPELCSLACRIPRTLREKLRKAPAARHVMKSSWPWQNTWRTTLSCDQNHAPALSGCSPGNQMGRRAQFLSLEGGLPQINSRTRDYQTPHRQIDMRDVPVESGTPSDGCMRRLPWGLTLKSQ